MNLVIWGVNWGFYGGKYCTHYETQTSKKEDFLNLNRHRRLTLNLIYHKPTLGIANVGKGG